MSDTFEIQASAQDNTKICPLEFIKESESIDHIYMMIEEEMNKELTEIFEPKEVEEQISRIPYYLSNFITIINEILERHEHILRVRKANRISIL
jgi:predicted KAP-like P-loop ATPase